MLVWSMPQLVSTQIFYWLVDADFGVVRLGLGAQPSSVVYEIEGSQDAEETALFRMAAKLQEDSRFVTDIG